MAAPGAGAGVGGDIYEIPLDLTKVQNKQKPTKTFEEQTAEEQAKGGILGKTSSSKGILKRPGQPKKTGNLKFGQCIVYEYPKDDQSTAIAKRVDSKDISDMRDEKAKMRDLLQEKENEQLAQIKKMQQMMGGKETTTAKIDESVGSKSKITESYNSDTFEDSNISGSGKKQGINYWPGKEKMGADESSASVSQSKDKGDQVFSANAMEEYLKKKQAESSGQTTTAAPQPVAKKGKDVSESSDKYTDEDFDSVSKSQSHSFPSAAVLAQKSQQMTFQTPASGPSEIAQRYVKKENVFTMTDENRYTMDKN